MQSNLLLKTMKNIIIKLQVEGVHRWSKCNIDEVSYLINSHRHIFHVVCKKEVTDNDREIEIIQFKHQILDFLKYRYYRERERLHDFEGLSCEMIAQLLFEEFELSYCSVLEDNENGAEIS